MTIVSAAFLLLMVMDPMGNVPFFIAALRHVEPARHRRVVVRELLIALAVMVAFLFVGRFALQVLHISEPALTLAGGVILFLIAIRMVFPSSERSMHEDVKGEPFIVPLAIPYVAGPSLLAAESLLMSKEPDRWPEWLLSLLLAWLVSRRGVVFFERHAAVFGRARADRHRAVDGNDPGRGVDSDDVERAEGGDGGTDAIRHYGVANSCSHDLAVKIASAIRSRRSRSLIPFKADSDSGVGGPIYFRPSRSNIRCWPSTRPSSSITS